MAGIGDSPPRVDWGMGRYERTALQLAPVSAVVVERAAVRPSERVLDLGCGTGNAALLAAARGGIVTGVDPAARLLEVAGARAAEQNLEVRFELGEAAAIPIDSGSVDVVLSVFGVIFAPDPVAAAAEIARVCRPSGRFVLSAWLPGGPVSQVVRIARETALAALGAPPMPPPFAWQDDVALSRLLGPHGFEVEVAERSHDFTADSVDDYLQAELLDHPLNVCAQAMLAAAGKGEVQSEIITRVRDLLTEANEDPDGFAVSGSYVVATAQRS